MVIEGADVPRPPQHRDKLVQTAVRLFRQKGFAATGLNEILRRSGAPRGSLYHYFPDGKAQIGAEAVRTAGAVVTRTLDGLLERTEDGASFLAAYAALLARWIEASDYRDGCPIATTLLETTPDSAAIAEAGQGAFAAWIERIALAFERDGLTPGAARTHAQVVIAAIEGALLLARVQRSTAPIHAVARALERPV
jgi:TetR/AcrR family transcriptional repressor of lmrAB and yxaGH operons